MMRKTKEKKPRTGGQDKVLKPMFINLLLLLVGYALCRLAFWAENRQFFQLDLGEVWGIVRGGFVFDMAAIAYTNALYLVMVLLPLHWKETRKWQLATKVVFVAVNWVALVANLADAVYFPFVKRRTTSSVFTEFANDNLADIFGIELVNHWLLWHQRRLLHNSDVPNPQRPIPRHIGGSEHGRRRFGRDDG